MPESAGGERIRRFLGELAKRGSDALFDYFAPDVVWHVGRGNPGPGSYKGVDALAAYYRSHRLKEEPVQVESLTVLSGDTYGAVFTDVTVPLPDGEMRMLLPQLFRTGPDGRWNEYWILRPPKRTPPMPETLAELEERGFLNGSWYYTIELAPGKFTPGHRHVNLGLTRRLLSKTAVEGYRCLDLGTQEGAVPVLLSRRNAAQIVAVDVQVLDPEVRLVQRFTGAEYNYHSGLTHQQTVPFLHARYGGNFDLVVFSGVMYHCFSPLHALGTARSLVRTGGILIVETNAAVDAESAMFFNVRGRFSFDSSTYFLTSVPLLEYLLRYFRLQPLDCVAGPHTPDGGKKAARVAIACRAVDEMPGEVDPWMEGGPAQIDYNAHIAWHLLDSGGNDGPAYGPPVSPFVDLETGICDVVRTVNQARPMDLPPEVAVIRLGDRY